MSTDEPTPASPDGLGAPPGALEHHVLVPVDRSPTSRRAAVIGAGLARGLGAGVRLMTASFGSGGAAEGDDSIDGALAHLRATAHELGLDDARCEVVADEFPAQAIVEVAARPGVEAICMATFAHGVMPHTLGGVADEVVHDTTVPIVLLGPTVADDPAPIGGRAIVVPLDGSAAAASILPLVADWATRLGTSVHLVSVDPGDGTGCPSGQLEASRDVFTAGGTDTAVHHLRGADVAATLLAFADSVDAGLVALSPTGHGGAMNRALGYVATDVVRRASIPVLVRRVSAATRR
jgi:nucleotide-binding universal stress UspA family protein